MNVLSPSLQEICADTPCSSLTAILFALVLFTSAPPQQRLGRWDSFRDK